MVVPLEVGQCSLATVAESINQQVGFPVVLLDSKGYRIIESNITNSPEFWKSNHKILAASMLVYEKLKGTCSTFQDAVDLTVEEDTPRSKRPCPSRTDDSKLHKILEGVDCLQKRSVLLKYVSSAFECVLCKSVMCKPQFVTCCNRIVGCQTCVSRWFDENGCCPHCSTVDARCIEFKGVDDLLAYTRKLCGDTATIDDAGTDSDSDFELPKVNFKRP